MSFWSAFSSKEAQQKPEAPPAPAQQSQGPQSKAIPVGHASLAHPQHHEGATDLDLYRTFSPSDVGMWSWQATTGENPSAGKPSFWGKLFSTNSNK